MIFFKRSVVILLLLAWQMSGQASSLKEIQQLADKGAVSLAIQILEKQQAKYVEQKSIWISLEQQRIALYKQREDWQKISERLKELPKTSEITFIQWARTERAIALLELHKPAEAREELRYLIWKTQIAKTNLELLTHWRKLIVRSYLNDSFANDAQIASFRLQQDVPQDDLSDVILRARIAIENRRSDEAEKLLKPYADNPEVAALILLAQLRGQSRSPKHVLQAAYRYIRNKQTANELKVNLWAVAAEAARQNGSRAAMANAMEHVLANKQHLRLSDNVSKFNSDSLWNAYIDYALIISNQEQLLIGQDKAWLNVADKLVKKQPVGSRSMNVFVMLRGKEQKLREQAASAFVASVLKREHGKQLLLNLFKDSKYFKHLVAIPKPVRHALVDIALGSSDIDRASEIMATIKAPLSAEDTDQFMWQLRRSRILVLGNQAEAGAEALFEILKQNPKLPQDQLDKLMQVIFDLQTAGQHEYAYRLFTEVLKLSKDEKLQRELYYWMADSQKAAESYAEAARLYLKSALHPDPENIDPWAQTAIYQAAVSLTQAGFYRDAQTLYERLLKVTEDPARRATLKRELQRLWAIQ